MPTTLEIDGSSIAWQMDQTVRGGKLADSLRRIITARRGGSLIAARAEADTLQLRMDGERVLVRLAIRPPPDDALAKLAAGRGAGNDDDDAARAAALEAVSVVEEDVTRLVVAQGGRIAGVTRDHAAINAWVPVDVLESIAAAANVVLVAEPLHAHPLAMSEGASAMNAPLWHSGGAAGAGVRVGIIDAGFLGYTALLGSELPPANHVIVKNFVEVGNDALVDGFNRHGTAVAEVVHDVAPAATFYLAKIWTDTDLQNAVDWMIANDVDVINASLGFYNAGPGDGTGLINGFVAAAASHGIPWVAAAGNDGDRHWSGAFTNQDGDGSHEFAGGIEVNAFGDGPGGFYLLGELPPVITATRLEAHLRWSDWINRKSGSRPRHHALERIHMGHRGDE